jgi:molecular chaperone GrpE
MQQDKQHGENQQTEKDLDELKDLEILRRTLGEEKDRAESNLKNWQRIQADFINFKRRSEQEKQDMKELANSALICNLLPVLDDLELALRSIPPRLTKIPWVEGIRLIERKFHAILEIHGVKPIRAKGKPFDPTLHEAAMNIQGKEGTVIKELKRGYKLRDRVIRPTTVAVGNGNPKNKS